VSYLKYMLDRDTLIQIDRQGAREDYVFQSGHVVRFVERGAHGTREEQLIEPWERHSW